MKYCFLVLFLVSGLCTAGDLKSGGQYEANLRNVGVPISNGMTFQK